jgi:hypothetical protein
MKLAFSASEGNSLEFEYLCEFEYKFKTALNQESRDLVVQFTEIS